MNLNNFSIPRPNVEIFRNARQNFFRRQQAMEEADLERQAEQDEPSQRQEMQERTPGSTILRRFTDLRPPTIASFISRRSSRNAPQPRPSSSNYDNEDLESPKSPRFSLGMPNLPSTRLHLPNLSRTWTQGSNGPPSRPGTARSQHAGRPSLSRARPEDSPVIAEPMPAVPAEHVRPSGRSRQRGDQEPLDAPDPAESHLASMVNDGRRRRRHRHGRSASDRDRAPEGRTQRRSRRRRVESSRRSPPKRFMFCLPWIRSRRIRSQVLRCFVSGLFLTLLLSVYLALSITKNINNSEFTVLLILIILFTTIFFCHGLIRLCMLIVKPRNEDDERRRDLPQMYGPGGYAIPRRPIRVVLARDEEAAGIESETAKTKPPAYGLWRESVRVDPNRIFWQRNENASDTTEEEPRTGSRGQTVPRPPSYASDDGVSYVIEAQPRSTAPASETSSLPQHPSEAGRGGRPAQW